MNSKSKKTTNSDEIIERQDFDLFQALEALDKKNYSYFDNLTEEQQRKFSPYMMLYWMSNINKSGMLGTYYVVSTDLHANKYMFNEIVQKHIKLQWLMLCASSPNMGKQFHSYLPHLNVKFSNLKEKLTSKIVMDYFSKIYKNVNPDDLSLYVNKTVEDQQHKHRIAEILPNAKISDIETLSKLLSKEELDEYDRQSGN